MPAKRKPKLQPEKEWYCVRLRVTLSGAKVFVLASSAKDALEAARAGEWEGDVDTEMSELVDWEVRGVEKE